MASRTVEKTSGSENKNGTDEYGVIKGSAIPCPECDANLEIPGDMLSGEIVRCPDCGMDWEAKVSTDGKVSLVPAEVEGEDWGE
jgi:alpha-aminoadipate carrier protein LysW